MLDYRPDQGTGFVNLAPAVLINYADIASTQLIQPGSRVTYAALFAGAAAAVETFRDYLIAAKTPGERLREVDESSRQLNSAIDRASRFLNLASLASVLLAAVAVAMGARRYAARHIDAVALDEVHGRVAALRARDFRHRTDAARARRGRRRLAARVFRAVRTRMAAARSRSAPSCRRPRSRRWPLRW